MKKIEDRQQSIKDMLSTVEHINVEVLAEKLNVTGATIRKDLRTLESLGEISRSRGIVSLVRPYIVDQNVKDKMFVNAEQKSKIGLYAVSLIEENDSILLTSGSTIEAMARLVKANGFLNVVTPSLAVALALTQKENVDIFVLGGKLHRNSLSMRDLYAAEGLRDISCSKAFFSCDGIDFESGVITALEDEARFTRHMICNARERILLVDSSKFGQTGFGKICDLDFVTTLITDTCLQDQHRRRIEGMGIKLVIV